MTNQQFTQEELAEIYFALGARVNRLIEQKKSAETGNMSRLIDRQLERSNDALAAVEQMIGETAI